ncbi:MAG: hypothetical protein ACHQ49_01850 [Elusimicrobiota bacterium]
MKIKINLVTLLATAAVVGAVLYWHGAGRPPESPGAPSSTSGIQPPTKAQSVPSSPARIDAASRAADASAIMAPAAAGGCSLAGAPGAVAAYAHARARRQADLSRAAMSTPLPSRPDDKAAISAAAERLSKLKAGAAAIDKELDAQFPAGTAASYRDFVKRCGARAFR